MLRFFIGTPSEPADPSKRIDEPEQWAQRIRERRDCKRAASAAAVLQMSARHWRSSTWNFLMSSALSGAALFSLRIGMQLTNEWLRARDWTDSALSWCANRMADIYFTDFFKIPRSTLARYGALNVSLVADLPLFIDPFLLFNSRKRAYRALHDEVIHYLRFLRDRSVVGDLHPGLLKTWFTFSEVHQNWLGYSKTGNRGSALGPAFATALNRNLSTVFQDFGHPGVARGNHLEKLCLIRDGVGRDRISDFTTNLLEAFLLEYTQRFAVQYLVPEMRRQVMVNRVRFNYDTETWEGSSFELPWFEGDYVLLTPRDLLTKDETWINRPDLVDGYEHIAQSMDNAGLRAQMDNYLRKQLTPKSTPRERRSAVSAMLQEFPEFLEYYIRYKEDHGDQARAESEAKVKESEQLFIDQVSVLVAKLQDTTAFYGQSAGTFREARERALYLKDIIENKDGYRVFYRGDRPVGREVDAQILFRLTWCGTTADVNREVNNGRGPADFKISRGKFDASLVELKLASNKALERNLQHQVPIYEKASDVKQSLKIIVYFSAAELLKVQGILHRLKLLGDERIILIDARSDNKTSASKAGTRTGARSRS